MSTEGSVSEALANLEAINSDDPVGIEDIRGTRSTQQGEDPRTARSEASGPTGTYSLDGHEDIRRLFLDVLNLCEPTHPYVNDPYPLDYEWVEWSYCTQSSPYNAKCGPRDPVTHSETAYVKFYADKDQFVDNWSIERSLQCLVHEITHVGETNHPPEFWQAMADNMLIVRDYLEHRDGSGNYPELAQVAPHIDVETFERHAVMNPNSVMTDRRSMTVTEQREAIRQRLGAYHIAEDDL